MTSVDKYRVLLQMVHFQPNSGQLWRVKLCYIRKPCDVRIEYTSQDFEFTSQDIEYSSQDFEYTSQYFEYTSQDTENTSQDY